MKNVIADEAGVPELYVPGQTLRWRDDNNVEAKINYVRKVNGIDHYCVEYRNGYMKGEKLLLSSFGIKMRYQAADRH